ncbi:hypothetical protein BDZ45DRAFT_742624 [Acephala macrosclerotiorum]|nr:hypothetical protein BDZ45DRAFT_742624 [Acephala macrosclerotiorum]
MARLKNPHRFLLDLDKVLRQPPQDKNRPPVVNDAITSTNEDFTVNRIVSIHTLPTIKGISAVNMNSSSSNNAATASQFRILGGALYYMTAMNTDELKQNGKKFVVVAVAPAAGAVDASLIPAGQVHDYLLHDGTVFGLCAVNLAPYDRQFLDACVQVIFVNKPRNIVASWTAAQHAALMYHIEKRIREVGHGLSGNDRKKFSFIADTMNRCSEISNGRRIKFPQRTWNAIDTKIKKFPSTKAAYATLLANVLQEMNTPGYVAPDMPERLVWGDGDVIHEDSDEVEEAGAGVGEDHNMERIDSEEEGAAIEDGADIEEDSGGDEEDEDSDEDEDSGDEEEDVEGETYGLGYGNNYEF